MEFIVLFARNNGWLVSAEDGNELVCLNLYKGKERNLYYNFSDDPLRLPVECVKRLATMFVGTFFKCCRGLFHGVNVAYQQF